VGVCHDLGEVFPQERLAAGDDEGRPLELDQLVDEERLGLGGGQLTGTLAPGVGVAVRAGQAQKLP